MQQSSNLQEPKQAELSAEPLIYLGCARMPEDMCPIYCNENIGLYSADEWREWFSKYGIIVSQYVQ